jgi:hypothetical protein
MEWYVENHWTPNITTPLTQSRLSLPSTIPAMLTTHICISLSQNMPTTNWMDRKSPWHPQCATSKAISTSVFSTPDSYFSHLTLQLFSPGRSLEEITSEFVVSADLGLLDDQSQAKVDGEIQNYLSTGGELRAFRRVSHQCRIYAPSEVW